MWGAQPLLPLPLSTRPPFLIGRYGTEFIHVYTFIYVKRWRRFCVYLMFTWVFLADEKCQSSSIVANAQKWQFYFKNEKFVSHDAFKLNKHHNFKRFLSWERTLANRTDCLRTLQDTQEKNKKKVTATSAVREQIMNAMSCSTEIHVDTYQSQQHASQCRKPSKFIRSIHHSSSHTRWPASAAAGGHQIYVASLPS